MKGISLEIRGRLKRYAGAEPIRSAAILKKCVYGDYWFYLKSDHQVLLRLAIVDMWSTEIPLFPEVVTPRSSCQPLAQPVSLSVQKVSYFSHQTHRAISSLHVERVPPVNVFAYVFSEGSGGGGFNHSNKHPSTDWNSAGGSRVSALDMIALKHP